MKEKKELVDLLKKSGVKIIKTGKNYDWEEIYFDNNNLTVEKLQTISLIVENFFYVENKFTHNLPKFIGKDNCVCLIFDKKLLTEI
jgi:hypothetical protein